MSLKGWFLKKALTGKLPNWMYRFAGKKIAVKLGITEDNMADTEQGTVKTWYKSKAKIAAIVTAIVAAIQPISTAFGTPIVVPQWVIELLIGLGIYGVRDAINK